jgi:hypothetical protein
VEEGIGSRSGNFLNVKAYFAAGKTKLNAVYSG